MNDWIKNLKEGDMVIVSNTWHTTITHVDKITPTGLIKIGADLFYQTGSKRGGGTWDSEHLREATPETIAKIRADVAISKAINLMRNTPKITYDQAVKIIEILGKEDI
jgi:hypothetical protein